MLIIGFFVVRTFFPSSGFHSRCVQHMSALASFDPGDGAAALLFFLAPLLSRGLTPTSAPLNISGLGWPGLVRLAGSGMCSLSSHFLF